MVFISLKRLHCYKVVNQKSEIWFLAFFKFLLNRAFFTSNWKINCYRLSGWKYTEHRQRRHLIEIPSFYIEKPNTISATSVSKYLYTLIFFDSFRYITFHIFCLLFVESNPSLNFTSEKKMVPSFRIYLSTHRKITRAKNCHPSF